MHEEGRIISAEKMYNRKLCYYYGICHGLFKRRADELAYTPEIAVEEIEKIRRAFLGFYEIGEGCFNVNLSQQKEKILPILDEAVAAFTSVRE